MEKIQKLYSRSEKINEVLKYLLENNIRNKKKHSGKKWMKEKKQMKDGKRL